MQIIFSDIWLFLLSVADLLLCCSSKGTWYITYQDIEKCIYLGISALYKNDQMDLSYLCGWKLQRFYYSRSECQRSPILDKRVDKIIEINHITFKDRNTFLKLCFFYNTVPFITFLTAIDCYLWKGKSIFLNILRKSSRKLSNWLLYTFNIVSTDSIVNRQSTIKLHFMNQEGQLRNPCLNLQLKCTLMAKYKRGIWMAS